MTFRSPFIESLWPWAAATAGVVVWWLLDYPFPPSPDGLFGAAATLASIFASFLGVSKAIILSIKSTETYKVLQKLNYTDVLYKYLKAGIIASVTFAGLSILGFFIGINPGKTILGYSVPGVLKALWIWFGILALCTYVRITGILFKLLKVA